ncbi:MAG: TlpA disulfide reductase family protein [Angelakisella sp.]
MKQKTKTILGIAGFAVFLCVATIAYQLLSKTVSPQSNLPATNGKSEGGGSGSTAAEAENPKAPDFTVVDGDGNEVKLSELVGKPLVLNFWASWCSPCKAEMPDFNTVYEELGEEVTFVMVNLVDGQRETLESGKKHIADNKFTFPVYFDTKRDAALNYGISSIPTTYFIDKDGYVVTGARGAIDEKSIRKGIAMITEQATK